MSLSAIKCRFGNKINKQDRRLKRKAAKENAHFEKKNNYLKIICLLFICACIITGCANHSAEGDTNGLGMINGEVVPIKTDYPVPHLGWNNLESKHPLLNQDVYFIHSYYVQTDAPIVATADYGLPITAIVQSGNKIGIQFHPEKSGDYGLEILNQALKGGFIHD